MVQVREDGGSAVITNGVTTGGRLFRVLVAVALAVPVVPIMSDTPLVLATSTLSPTTAWEIDGNAVVNGNGGVANVSVAGDWGNDAGTSWSGGNYGPGNTPGGLPSTGSYYLWRDMDACNSLSDTIGVGGDKVDDGPQWPVITGSAPSASMSRARSTSVSPSVTSPARSATAPPPTASPIPIRTPRLRPQRTAGRRRPTCRSWPRPVTTAPTTSIRC